VDVRRRGEIVLWPAYFDSTKTRAEGRKVPKRLAKSSPTLSMLEKAVGNLGLSCALVEDAVHPRYPWRKTGFVLVKKSKPKNQLLKEVAAELSRLGV
jgi:signal recognition particle subunit SRP19